MTESVQILSKMWSSMIEVQMMLSGSRSSQPDDYILRIRKDQRDTNRRGEEDPIPTFMCVRKSVR